MADTGAPWNLPYPLPTDLVRDGADDIRGLAEAAADRLTDVSAGGIGPNIAYTKVTAVFTTTSTTYTPVTNFEATITPTSDSAKVLVICSYRYSTNAAAAPVTRLMRGATEVTTWGALGDVFAAHNTAALNFADVTQVFLDSPNTDTATTYSIEVLTNQNTVHIGTRGDGSAGQRRDYTMTLIEVAA